jgi:CheY-like chemotaxis protein
MPVVLVVDDSPVDRRLISGILQKSGRLRIETAVNGADAMERLRQVSPDIIVTDLTMPELDGLQLVTMVRLHFPKIPVVLVTAHGSESLAVQALEQGAASY